MTGTTTTLQAATRQMWERQEGESAKAWNAFRLYRDMEPTERSIAKIAAKLGYSAPVLCERWSMRNNWVARALAYDEYTDLQARNSRERERLAASDRRIQIAKNMQLVGGAAIQDLGKKIQDALRSGKAIPKISLKDATAIINAGVQIERLESGESTANLAVEGTIRIEDVMKRERELMDIIKEAIRAEADPETTRRIIGYIESRCAAQRD